MTVVISVNSEQKNNTSSSAIVISMVQRWWSIVVASIFIFVSKWDGSIIGYLEFSKRQ